jgi:hypothetical protein
LELDLLAHKAHRVVDQDQKDRRVIKGLEVIWVFMDHKVIRDREVI